MPKGDDERKGEEYDLDQVIGTAVKQRRMKLGLSLDDLCDRINAETTLGWVAGTVSKIESGKRRLKVAELAVLCWALETDAGYLIDSPWQLAPPYQGWTGQRMADNLTRKRGRTDLIDEGKAHAAQEARRDSELKARIAKSLELRDPMVTDDGSELWYAPHHEEAVVDLDEVAFRLFGDSLLGAREGITAELIDEREAWRQGKELPEGLKRQAQAEATRRITRLLAEALYGEVQ